MTPNGCGLRQYQQIQKRDYYKCHYFLSLFASLNIYLKNNNDARMRYMAR